MTDKLRIALIGCGKMGIHHARAIELQNNADLVAVADPNASDETINSLPGKPQRFSTAEELLDQINPDIVHIVTPPETHTELAKLALNHGAHVYVEKPFSLTTEDTKLILALADEKNLKVCAAHQVLFQTTGQKYQHYVKYIKKIIHVESYFSFKTVRSSISPVDQLIDILPHPVYLMLSAFNCETDYRNDSPLEMQSVEVDAKGEVRAIFRKGDAHAILIVTLQGRPIESYLRICGTNGSINADFVLSGVSKHLGPGASAIAAVLQPFSLARQVTFGTIANIFRMVFKKHKSYAGLAELIESFYGSIINGSPLPVSHQDIMDTVHICEKISTKLKESESIYEQEGSEQLKQTEASLEQIDPSKGAVLVTGGTGFLGRILVHELRSKGWSVRVIARRMPSYWSRVPGVEYVVGDISGELPVEFFKDITSIVHLAAETAGGKLEHERNTIGATRNMIEACNNYKIQNFINISSIAVLKPSTKLGGPLSEDSPVDHDNLGRGPYVWGKAKAEQIVSEAGEKYGINVRTIRLGPLVDFQDYTPPGRLGREVGPLFVAMGSKGNHLSLCDVHTAASVIRFYIEDIMQAPEFLNLVEPNAPTRKELLAKHLANRKELKTLWLPDPVLKALSSTIKLLLKLLHPGKKPLDVYAAFAAERYNASLAGEVIKKAQNT